jgi:hypothetical protein
MRRYLIALVAYGAFTTPAIAAKFDMNLQASPEQTFRLLHGVRALDSASPHSTVRLIQAEGPIKKRSTVQVLVMNHGEKPFDFGAESVSARLADGTSVPIITYERLMKEEKKHQMWAAIATGLGAAGNSMNAANAGYVSGSATYSGSTYGTFGSTPYSAHTSGTAYVTAYDPARAQVAQSIANQENQANFERLADRHAANIQALGGMLRTTTVDPGQMFGGSVMFELPTSVRRSKGPVPVTFFVNVGGEEHRFEAVLQPR